MTTRVRRTPLLIQLAIIHVQDIEAAVRVRCPAYPPLGGVKGVLEDSICVEAQAMVSAPTDPLQHLHLPCCILHHQIVPSGRVQALHACSNIATPLTTPTTLYLEENKFLSIDHLLPVNSIKVVGQLQLLFLLSYTPLHMPATWRDTCY